MCLHTRITDNGMWCSPESHDIVFVSLVFGTMVLVSELVLLECLNNFTPSDVPSIYIVLCRDSDRTTESYIGVHLTGGTRPVFFFSVDTFPCKRLCGCGDVWNLRIILSFFENDGWGEEGNYTLLLKVITDKDDMNPTEGFVSADSLLEPHTQMCQIPCIDHISLIGCYHFDVFQFTS